MACCETEMPGRPILHTPWKAGPAAGAAGPLLISFTAYTTQRPIELPGIWRAGLHLRRSWPQIEGAVGLWLWGEATGRRAGSVSVWRGEEDLLRFVRWAPHVEVMRRYRRRGSLISRSWRSERLDPPQLWREVRRIAAAEPA
jgi:hypothetical protein